ncbi:BrnT family toxin [Paracidobacterium acidisoli]|uniref:BrnT family toxin n=1 Tax=Paracidobacterium acidisoli TaxID=2303751 RepID=A0A372IJ55_9BACT|nr:BrnT family toxin [Paracidobacterium acidisoli]
MYEWDEAKREASLRKHGLDFADAYLVCEHPEKLMLLSARTDEQRRMDLALVEVHGSLLCVVCTERGNDIRIISFRRASRRERRLYAAAKN